MVVVLLCVAYIVKAYIALRNCAPHPRCIILRQKPPQHTDCGDWIEEFEIVWRHIEKKPQSIIAANAVRNLCGTSSWKTRNCVAPKTNYCSAYIVDCLVKFRNSIPYYIVNIYIVFGRFIYTIIIYNAPIILSMLLSMTTNKNTKTKT